MANLVNKYYVVEQNALFIPNPQNNSLIFISSLCKVDSLLHQKKHNSHDIKNVILKLFVSLEDIYNRNGFHELLSILSSTRNTNIRHINRNQ